jgi:hypothetical protein
MAEARANGIEYTIMPDNTVLAYGVRIGLCKEKRCDAYYDGARWLVNDSPVPSMLDAIRWVHRNWKEHIKCLEDSR